MSNRSKLSLIALSIAIGMSSVFVFVASRHQTERQTAAMTLIQDMDGIDQQFSQASREFGFALRQFLEGVEADPRTVRQSHRTLVRSVDQSIAVVSRLQAPESEQGAAFISAERKFLLVQRHIIREDFGKLLALLDDASIPLPQRVTSIKDIVNAAFAKTEQEFAAVEVTREKFAKEFAIHLTVE